MAHYAILDGDNYVINVIVGKDEDEIIKKEKGMFLIVFIT